MKKIGKKVNKIITDCEKFYKECHTLADGKKYNQSSLWGDKKFSLQILEGARQ